MEAQWSVGQVVFVPSEASWEAVTVLESRGFAANAVITVAPLSSPSARRQLSKEEWCARVRVCM
jgi:hypothetical protein